MGLLEDVAGKYGKDSNWNALRGRTDDPLLQQLTSQYGTFAAGSDGMPNWNALRGMVSATPRPAPAMTPPQQTAASPAAAPPPTVGTGASTAASIAPADVAKPASAGGGGSGATTNNAATSIVAMQNASPMPTTMPVEAPGALRPGLGDRMPPQYGSALAGLLRARTYGRIV